MSRVAATDHRTVIDSAVGPLTAVVDERGGLVSLSFRDEPARGTLADAPTSAACAEGVARLTAELGEYFAGTRRAFTMPLAPRGTPFQRQVWDELYRIP